jgi:hypothetical protein
MTNVVNFPKKNTHIDVPRTEEELEESVRRIREMFFDMSSVELSSTVFARAVLHGFDVSDNEHIKDCILVVEAVKSLLMKTKGEYHALQSYAENNINYEEDDMIYGDELNDE